jgi:hypothetical protein
MTEGALEIVIGHALKSGAFTDRRSAGVWA